MGIQYLGSCMNFPFQAIPNISLSLSKLCLNSFANIPFVIHSVLVLRL